VKDDAKAFGNAAIQVSGPAAIQVSGPAGIQVSGPAGIHSGGVPPNQVPLGYAA